MASCKDCIHSEICASHLKVVRGIYGAVMSISGREVNRIEKALSEISITIEQICCDGCDHFHDSSRFVELPHAEWVEDEDMYGDPIYRCSNCNEHFVLEEGTPTDNCYSYCPNCGAKMDEQALKERENNAGRNDI